MLRRNDMRAGGQDANLAAEEAMSEERNYFFKKTKVSSSQAPKGSKLNFADVKGA